MESKKQANFNDEDLNFEEKKKLILPLMKETIAKYRVAFIEFQIPTDMQVDVFCVMLAELVPMEHKYAPLMGDYVRRTLMLAYKAGDLLSKTHKNDGEEQ